MLRPIFGAITIPEVVTHGSLDKRYGNTQSFMASGTEKSGISR
jgi:hypothetical protein